MHPDLRHRLETLATEGLEPAIRYTTSPQENTRRAQLRQLHLFQDILDLLRDSDQPQPPDPP